MVIKRIIPLPGGLPLFPILLTSSLSLLTAWAWTVLLAGRVLPWQATRGWALLFLLFLVVSAVRWWRYSREMFIAPVADGRRLTAMMWGAGPLAAVSLLFLGGCYLSDGFYVLLLQPFYRLQVVAIATVVVVLLETFLGTSTGWVRSSTPSVTSALRGAMESRGETVVLAGLVAVGVLQSMARSTPIGDDLGQYTEVALSLLAGAPYPIHQSPPYYVEVGMTQNNPGMPALSALLYLSFLVFGPTLSGIGVVLAVLEAGFPVLMYLALRSLTGNRLFAFVAAILIFLFPVYQLHVLGGPEPDTLFADLLLLSVVLAAKAARVPRWPWWTALGLALGLLANTRHEGLSFSIAILLVFAVFSRPRRLLLPLTVTYLIALAPFALTYLSVAGSVWPSSFGGTVSPRNVGANLALIDEIVLPWHLQAIGLSATGLAMLGVGMAISAAASLAFLWKTNRSLLFVPCLGGGYLCASFLIHPLILNSYSPVDVFRHWSSAIPYLWLSATSGFYWGCHLLARRLLGRTQLALALAGLALAAGMVFYETDQLAHPEWYLGGRWSLLWTGGSYLLTDVMRESIPIPPLSDARTGEELRQVQSKRLEPYNLRYTNAGEPYHWTTLVIALFGLVYAAVPIAIDLGVEAGNKETHGLRRFGFGGSVEGGT